MFKEMYLKKRDEILSTLKNIEKGNYIQIAFFKDRIEFETSKQGFARLWVDAVVSCNVGVRMRPREIRRITADKLDEIVFKILKPYEN
jgi:hypothetical protein